MLWDSYQFINNIKNLSIRLPKHYDLDNKFHYSFNIFYYLLKRPKKFRELVRGLTGDFPILRIMTDNKFVKTY